jgi:hypothetical protein
MDTMKGKNSLERGAKTDDPHRLHLVVSFLNIGD